MLPERLYLRGFLCYRDGQEATFTGRSLWMLAGPNGSGKSTLFDAITFALYGSHRGGKQHYEALIHRACDGLEVEFDFRLEAELYQARRTVRRDGKMTFQIRCRRESPDGGEWEEVAQTNSKAGFNRWVREHVGLTYECFVASVMLRQGKADCLLEAMPAERHHFLGEIVGLDHYKRLYERAKDKHTSAKAQAELCSRRLRDVPEVSEAQRLGAEEAARHAADACDAATASVNALAELRVRAETWQGLDSTRRKLLTEAALLDGFLARRDELEKEDRQFTFLEKHLDRLESYVKQAQQRRDAQQRLNELEPRQEKLAAEREKLDREAGEAEAALVEQEQESQRLGDFLQDVRREQAELATAIPWLVEWRREQQAARDAKQQADDAAACLKRLARQQTTLMAALPTAAQLDETDESLRGCLAALGQAEANRRAADERLARFHEVAGHQSCRYCGQSLPAEHVAAESGRLHAERDAALAAFKQKQTECEAARLRRDELQAEHRRGKESLQKLEGQIHSERHRQKSAEQREQESVQRCDAALDNLPASFRREAEPTDADPQASLPDLDACRSRESALSNCLARLQPQSAAAREAISDLQRQQAARNTRRKEIGEQWQELEREAFQLQARLGQLQETLSALHESLPEPWRSWSDEEAARQAPALRLQWRTLRQEDVAGKFAQLQKHQADRETTARLLAEVARQIDEIPESARCAAALIEQRLQSAQNDQRRRDRTCREAQDELTRLQTAASNRAALSLEHRQADRQRHLWSRLMDLLGRQGLQRDLVRQAERQIVDYAAAILDRLSCGSMQIELRASADDTEEQALDLLARTDSSPEPLDVHFLSGSQRFRISVALALAIGQYAGRARPVRSVVIDEGFGCLDAENRATMAAELRNLSTLLDRIILVSHQDEFITAFPDGYRCERIDGSTRLEEFHR